jgi:hypothetical protein
MLGQLEVTGVRLTAMELGNEINASGYNGDIPMPGTGRVLGLGDLNNPKDPEGPAITNGFRNYLRVMEALKDVRDHSKLNKLRPILLGRPGGLGAAVSKSLGRQGGSEPPGYHRVPSSKRTRQTGRWIWRSCLSDRRSACDRLGANARTRKEKYFLRTQPK